MEHFLELAECPPNGVDVGILLRAATRVRDARVDELTRPILDGGVTDGLVESLSVVLVGEELEHEPLFVDAGVATCVLADRRAAFKFGVGVEKFVFAQVDARSLDELSEVEAVAHISAVLQSATGAVTITSRNCSEGGAQMPRAISSFLTRAVNTRE